MATLTRTAQPAADAHSTLLTSSIPTPFPLPTAPERERILRQELLDQLATEEVVLDDNPLDEQPILKVSELSNTPQQEQSQHGLREIMPSIASVQKSCIMTLNDLLSGPMKWHPILPDRRHSMPSTPQITRAPSKLEIGQSSSALLTLVSNLRNREIAIDETQHAVENDQESDGESDTEMIHELRARVEGLSSSLSVTDAALAHALVSLLAHFNRLTIIHSTLTEPHPANTHTQPTTSALASPNTLNNPHSLADSGLGPTTSLIDALTTQLNYLQLSRLSHPNALSVATAPPALVVEAALLWSQIDEELEHVVAMCKDRNDALPRFSASASVSNNTAAAPTEHLPPQYEYEYGYSDYKFDVPPEYEMDGHGGAIDNDTKSTYSTTNHVGSSSIGTSGVSTNEKMRLDLDAVTMAIDRLYQVAPQLHNQRVELKSSKVAQMERARQAGGVVASHSMASMQSNHSNHTNASTRDGKQKENRDLRELETIMEMLGRASERKLADQVVVLDEGMNARMEKVRVRDNAKREAFVQTLIEHSSTGRLHTQDALLPPNSKTKSTKQKDPHALLTLPEFIREAMPDDLWLADSTALLSLPDFVREPVPPGVLVGVAELEVGEKEKQGGKGRGKGRRGGRGSGEGKEGKEGKEGREWGEMRKRSMSAPSLSWLRPSSRPSSSKGLAPTLETSEVSSSKAVDGIPSVSFEVHYVAENHETLQHALVFLIVTGATPGVDIEAEVLPSFSPFASAFSSSDSDGHDQEHSEEGKHREHVLDGEHLIVRSGVSISLPLRLPAKTKPGKVAVRVQSGHYEIKLITSPPSTSTSNDSRDSHASMNHAPATDLPLLDATQLTTSSPTSFICASCSLPLVHSTHIRRYRDLPSEHWEELVDAWMCHPDQVLSKEVGKYAGGAGVGQGRGGFWPEPGQALVGGSYILFEESAVVGSNICPGDQSKRGEDWRLVRCLCGSITGRCQERNTGDSTNSTVYRLLKYAIRPVSPTAEPFKIPLSAFIVQDMQEFVHAHATYRFVVLDEEEERPRILIWLFKPSIRISYKSATQYALPKSGSIHAAKVLFKIIGPGDAPEDLKTILQKYPGFPQAEYLFYPISICRRLAGMLKESNRTYPESLRTMTGLDVGWLQRA